MNGPMLAEHIGVTYRQLDFWCHNGYLRPRNPDEGRGRQREFSLAEVAVAVRMGRLVRAGVMPAVAAKIARGDRAAECELLYALQPPISSVSFTTGSGDSSVPGEPQRPSDGDLGVAS